MGTPGAPRPPVPATLARLAREIVGAATGVDVPTAAVRSLGGDGGSAVLAVDAPAPAVPMVLKLARVEEQPATDLARTAAAMARAAAAGVPVPRVLAVDASGSCDGWQHLLQERVEGRTWRTVHPRLDDPRQRLVQAQVAAVATALAAVRFDHVGELAGRGPPVAGSLVDVLRRRARHRVAGPSALRTADALLDRAADLLAGSPGPVLVHDDLHHDNVVVAPAGQGWRLVAVLDWDKAWAGPAEADLARLSCWDGMTGPGFWPGYRAAVPAAPGEGERLLVHRLLWCLEHAAPTARHRSDTARLCRRFGLRPPDD